MIIFKTLVDSDIQAVNDFYSNYHQIDRDIKKFEWEFHLCPQGKGIYTLAIDNESGKILGIQAGIPIELIDNKGNRYLTIKSEDSLIDIDACVRFRKNDVFKELYHFFIQECRKYGILCIWGFTWLENSLSRIGFSVPFKAVQGLLVFNPLMSFRHLSSLNPSNSKSRKFLIGIMVFLSYLIGQRRWINSALPEGLTITESLIPNEMLFQESIPSADQFFFINQDKTYLTWRLQNNPYPIQYRIINFWRIDHLLGQVILSFQSNGVGYIEQVLFSENLSISIQRNCLRHLLKLFRDSGICLVRSMTFDTNKMCRSVMKILKQTGFLFINHGMSFIFMPLKDDIPIKPERFVLSRLYTQGHG
jgi:hypothetical protein